MASWIQPSLDALLSIFLLLPSFSCIKYLEILSWRGWVLGQICWSSTESQQGAITGSKKTALVLSSFWDFPLLSRSPMPSLEMKDLHVSSAKTSMRKSWVRSSTVVQKRPESFFPHQSYWVKLQSTPRGRPASRALKISEGLQLRKTGYCYKLYRIQKATSHRLSLLYFF